MVTSVLLFQLENVSNKLLDYGLLGVMVIVIAFIAYKMYNKINDDQKEWRNIAKQQLEHNYKTSLEQNSINQRLIDIRERDIEQNRTNHLLVERKLEEFPKRVREELKNELNEQKMNHTSSAGQ